MPRFGAASQVLDSALPRSVVSTEWSVERAEYRWHAVRATERSRLRSVGAVLVPARRVEDSAGAPGLCIRGARNASGRRPPRADVTRILVCGTSSGTGSRVGLPADAVAAASTI